MSKLNSTQVAGGNGGAPNPDPTSLQDNEMIKFDTGTQAMEGTGDINTDAEVDFGSKDIKCKTVITESTSVDIGPGITLSDRGGYLENTSNVTKRKFLPVEYQIDDNGTLEPTYDSRGIKDVRFVTQSDESMQMIGISSYNIIPIQNEDVLRVYIKLINPINNFRARVISDVTGEIIKYIPSRNDFEKDTGLSFLSGERFFDLVSPLSEVIGYPITVEVFADESIDVLGDGVNPWRATDRQVIIPKRVTKDFFVVASDTTVNIGIDPNSPSFLTGLVKAKGGNFIVDIADGKIQNNTGKLLDSCTGTISFQPNKGGGGATGLNFWSERSTDGIVWTQNSKSLRSMEVANNGETFKTSFSGINDWQPGEYIRFRLYVTIGGVLDLVPPTDTVLGGEVIEGFSVIWELKES